MSKHLFGWSLPPGVSQRDIDEAYGNDRCPVCGDPLAGDEPCESTASGGAGLSTPAERVEAFTNTSGDPSPESEHVAEIFDEMHAQAIEGRKGEDAIVEYVEGMAQNHAYALGLLQSAVSLLPQRGAPPPCSCPGGDREFAWCELHDSGWEELTVREEIENFLNAAKGKE